MSEACAIPRACRASSAVCSSTSRRPGWGRDLRFRRLRFVVSGQAWLSHCLAVHKETLPSLVPSFAGITSSSTWRPARVRRTRPGPVSANPFLAQFVQGIQEPRVCGCLFLFVVLVPSCGNLAAKSRKSHKRVSYYSLSLSPYGITAASWFHHRSSF